MAEKGMTPTEAAFVEKQAAYMYRGLRICESTDFSLRMSEDLMREAGVSTVKDTENKVFSILDEKIKGKLDCTIDPDRIKGELKYLEDELTRTNLSPSYRAELLNHLAEIKDFKKRYEADKSSIIYDEKKCNLLKRFDAQYIKSSEMDKEKAKVKSKIQRYFDRSDAAYLYRKWYLGGTTQLGHKIPCSAVRVGGPLDLQKPQSLSGKLDKPWGWSDERYKGAVKLLSTWDVDFEWTAAQHEIGAKWGAEKCKGNKKPYPFSQAKCTTGDVNNSPTSGDPASSQSGTK